MAFCVCTAGDAVEIDEDADAVVVAFLEIVLHGGPGVQVHLCRVAFELCPCAECRSESEVSYRETDGVAFRDVFEPL